MKTFTDISYGEKPSQLLDVHLPDNDCFSALLYFHGGGFENGDKNSDSLKLFFDYMTSYGIAVISANYSMYPDAKYPEFIEDAALASFWVKNNISKYGDLKNIFVSGTSAGAYLSLMLCFDKRWLGRYGITASDFAGFIHDAGQPTCHFNVLKEKGIDTRRVIADEASPIYHVGESGPYPPMLFMLSENDIPGRYEQTMLMLKTLSSFGYSRENTDLKVLKGCHSEYIGMADQSGQSIFGKAIKDFIYSILSSK